MHLTIHCVTCEYGTNLKFGHLTLLTWFYAWEQSYINRLNTLWVVTFWSWKLRKAINPFSHICTYLFSNFPHCQFTHIFLRTGGEMQFVREAKCGINSIQKIQTAFDFTSNLLTHSKNNHHCYAHVTWSAVQKMWASSCWKRRTLVNPVRAPDNSLRWSTPKSAIRSGSSRQERGRWSNITLLIHQTMYKQENYLKAIPVTRTVHWFQCKLFFFYFKLEHVFLLDHMMQVTMDSKSPWLQQAHTA